MADISPAMRAAIAEYARDAADKAPPLTEEQERALRAALRRNAAPAQTTGRASGGN